MTANDFASLGLSEPLLRALAARDYTTPTPIQARAIPPLLQARDLLGIAQTGTGKTAAFALPMLQLLTASNHRPRPRMPRALVLAPTRELATQIADSFEAYGRHLHQRVAIVFGGVGQSPQVQALHRGVDILVATPGRLLDLMKQRHCDLADIEILVLDEADRMLDMGFLPDVRRILSTIPKDRQSLLFSATMPNDITALANGLLRNPLRIEVTPPAATADRVEQSLYFVTKAKKRDLLVALLEDPAFERTLVFTRTKHGADRVTKSLIQAGIKTHAIHGNKSQSARERALDDFRGGKTPVLVATDIAARGIDVPEITHVINFDLPNIPESYVHRIGRTARAGRAGIAISFCDSEEREFLRDIEKLLKKRIPVVTLQNQPARQPEPKAHPQPAARDENPWGQMPAETEHGFVDADLVTAEVNEEPPRRPRPAPKPVQRSTPGPYVPSIRDQQPRTPKGPRHERRPRQGSGRPAMPNAVDPEQRRGTNTRPDAPPTQRGPSQRGPSQRGPIQRGPVQRGPVQRGPIQRDSGQRDSGNDRQRGGGNTSRGPSGGGGAGGSGGQRPRPRAHDGPRPPKRR